MLEIRSLLAHFARASEHYIAISKAHHDIAPVLQAAGSGKGAWLHFAIIREPPQNSIGTIVSTFPSSSCSLSLVSSLSYSTQVNAAKIIVGFLAPPPWLQATPTVVAYCDTPSWRGKIAVAVRTLVVFALLSRFSFDNSLHRVVIKYSRFVCLFFFMFHFSSLSFSRFVAFSTYLIFLFAFLNKPFQFVCSVCSDIFSSTQLIITS